MSKFNYFQNIYVDGYDFPDEPQVKFGFHSSGISLINRSGSIIQYSFNGSDAHGDLDPSDASNSLMFDGRMENAMFLRGVDGYGIIRVEAWGHSGGKW